MTASGSPTIDVVAYPVTAPVEPRYVLDHKRRRSSAARQPRRALGALVEVGVLLLVVWFKKLGFIEYDGDLPLKIDSSLLSVVLHD